MQTERFLERGAVFIDNRQEFFLSESNFLRRGQLMVIQITPEELQKMKHILLDEDSDEALKLIKIFCKRLTEQLNKGMKSHLDTL